MKKIIIPTLITITAFIAIMFAYQNTLKARKAKQHIIKTNAIRDAFEDTLNNMLQNIESTITEYRLERQIINHITQPEALRQKENLESNIALVESTTTALNQKVEEILTVFQETDLHIQSLLNEGEHTQALHDEWARIKKKHIEDYLTFFTAQSDIIESQKRLLHFYKKNAKDINASDTPLPFKNYLLNTQAQILERQINQKKNTKHN